MLPTVQAHHYRSFQLHHIIFTTLLLFASFNYAVAGQGFTAGLSIIDAPSAGSPGHAGSPLAIAVDVSGNGQLSSDSASPTSLLPTHFYSIEIYLVSSQTNTNLTVSSGNSFLMGDSGSVRHLNWIIPTCTPPGQYNLTFYEFSTINEEPHFIISPVSIPVDNSNPSGPCTVADGINQLQPQPQPSSPPAQVPFQPDQPFGSISASDPNVVTFTLASDGSFSLPTLTQTATVSASASTIVIVSMETQTLTATVTGQQGIETSVTTVTQQITQQITTTLGTQSDNSNNSNFIPVNAARSRHPMPLLSYSFTFLIIRLSYHYFMK